MPGLKKAIEREIAAGLFPGCVAWGGRLDGPELACACGLAEREPARSLRLDSIFDLASVTKVVATATAVGQQLEAGRFTLDTPAADLLPEYAEFLPAELSVRHLATHSSGYSNEKPEMSLSGEAALRDWLRRPAGAEPGTVHEYVCRNMVLLSLIVEKCAGQAFGEYCRERIFAPLAMHDTGFGPLTPSTRLVRFYSGVPLGQINDEPARAISEAGRAVGNAGVFSTAGDLARFARMMLGGGELDGQRILRPETVELLTGRHSPPGLAVYGVCWHTDPRPHIPQKSKRRPAGLSARAYGHLGYTGQSLWLDPEQGLYLIVLTNRLHGAGWGAPHPAGDFNLLTNLARVRIGRVMVRELSVA